MKIKQQTKRGDFDVRYFNKTIDDYVIAFMKEKGLTGLLLATVQAPYIPISKGYGIADENAGVRKLVATRTIFPLGQVSTGYNAVAIAQAKEQGLLKFEDKLITYLPEFTNLEGFASLTIADLFYDRSGLADFRNAKNYDKAKKYSTKDILGFIKEVGFLTKNEQEEYPVYLSASNHYLLALIIEKVSGLSYEAFVRKFQLDIAGVKDTYFYSELSNLKQDELSDKKPMHTLFKQNPYFVNPAELAVGDAKDVFDANLKGFADVLASAQDVSVWDINLAGTNLTNDPADANAIYKPIKVKDKTINASCGWEFTYTPGFMDIYGSNGAGTTYLSRFTAISDLICVTLQTNKPNIDFTELARNIANALQTNLGFGLNPEYYGVIEAYKPYEEIIALIKKSNYLKKFVIKKDGNEETFSARLEGKKLNINDITLNITKDDKQRVWIWFKKPHNRSYKVFERFIVRLARNYQAH